MRPPVRVLAAAVSGMVLLVAPAAHAAWPEDVCLSCMETWQGIQVGGFQNEQLGKDYAQLIRELGAAVGTTTILPADSLGVKGFEIAAEANLAFTDTSNGDDTPAPWERAHNAEDPGPFYYAPGLMVRKGLPFSVDLGLKGSWIGGSRQGTFGGFARVAVVEGRKPWPDVNVHLGYTGYVGNDELELGTFELGGTLGSRFRVGSEGSIRSFSVAPYLDVSLLVVSASPILPDQVVTDIGAVSFGRRSASDALPNEKAIPLARFSGGIELRMNVFLIRLSGGYTLNALANGAVAVGFRY